MSDQNARQVIMELIRNAETLGALGALLSGLAGHAKPHPDAADKFAAVQRAIDPDLFADLSAEAAQTLHAAIVARVRRAAELAERPDQPPIWAPDDPALLQTQGRSSRLVTRLISAYAERKPALVNLLSAPSAFLDVGCGAGWIAISMAERWPMLRVDGLDIHQPALELAGHNVEVAALNSRVTFHRKSVAELDVDDAYEVAFVPFVFIPEPALQVAMPALAKAVKAGGWMFIACYREPEGALNRALWDLQTTTSGGRVWQQREVACLMESVGFEFVEDVGEDSPLNLYAARRI